jgi:hypothetical protein
MNAQTEMTEAQRQFDNKLLRLIQQHFPSIPLHGEEADKNWTRWLNFARDCAHLTKPDAGGGEAYPDFRPQLSKLYQAAEFMTETGNGEEAFEQAMHEAFTALAMDAHDASIRYTPPSDVPAEPKGCPRCGDTLIGEGHPCVTTEIQYDPDTVAFKPTCKQALQVAQPSAVPMPKAAHAETVLPNTRDEHKVEWYSADQLKAYATAHTAEAVRELVDGMVALLASYRRVLPPGSPQSDYEKHAHALIAKYTQTQKESK